MGDISIEIDSSDMLRQLKKLRKIKGGAPKALVRALNKTGKGMRTDAGKEVTSIYIIKQQKVKGEIRIVNASASNLSVVMRSEGRPSRLVNFKYRKNRSPGKKGAPTVYAQVRKDRGGGHITGGFVTTSKKGQLGIYTRYTDARYPLDQLHGPGVMQMLDEDTVKTNIQKKSQERFIKNLDHEVKYLLESAT